MKIFNITHMVDMDGMGSAALLMRNFKLPEENIFFFDYELSSFDYLERQIKKARPRNSLFILSDVGTSKGVFDRQMGLLKYLKKNGNTIMWLDHHHWTDEQIVECSKLCDVFIGGENKDFCGADLVLRTLCKSDKTNRAIAQAAHAADFLTPICLRGRLKWPLRKMAFALKHTVTLDDLDSTYPKLREVVSTVSEGKLTSSLIEREHAAYKKEEKVNLKELLSSAVVISGKKNKIAIGFSRRLQATNACATLRDKCGAPITVYIERDRCRGHVRVPIGSPLNIIPIAEAFGGGGHPAAGGFRFGFSKMTDAREKQILKRLSKLAAKFY